MTKKYSIWLLVVILSAVCLSPKRYIVITTDDWVCRWTADSFVLQWRHSVEKQLWQDYYQQQKDHFVLTHSFVQSFGAGVPSQGIPIKAPKGFVGLSHNLVVPIIDWVVSSRMQGVVIEPSSKFQFDIYKHLSDYSSVKIQSRTKSWLVWFWQDYTNTVPICQKIA